MIKFKFNSFITAATYSMKRCLMTQILLYTAERLFGVHFIITNFFLDIFYQGN